MSDSRLVVCEYCDDVRQEMGNKFSLMGCYGSELVVSSFPIVLPKFGALARAVTPIDLPFKKLTFRLFFESNLIAELDTPIEELAVPDSLPTWARWLWRAGILVVSPLVLEGPGVLRVDAETETGIAPGSKLNIRSATTTTVLADSLTKQA